MFYETGLVLTTNKTYNFPSSCLSLSIILYIYTCCGESSGPSFNTNGWRYPSPRGLWPISSDNAVKHEGGCDSRTPLYCPTKYAYTEILIKIHEHKIKHIYIYIFIYLYMCVCSEKYYAVCWFVRWTWGIAETARHFFQWDNWAQPKYSSAMQSSWACQA